MNLGLASKTTNDTPLDPFTEFKQGVEFLKNQYPEKALPKLQRAFDSDSHNPYFMSFLGVCIARAQRQWSQASELCEMAVKLDPKEIQFRLNLGEVYALAGQRGRALKTLDHAMKLFDNDARLKQARSKVEKRRAPLLPFLGRGHFLNRELGKLRHRILRRFD